MIVIVRVSSRLIFSIAVALTVACTQPLTIDPPSAEKQALLVLPAKLTHKAHLRSYGFAYAYEIVSESDAVPPLRVVFKLPLKPGMIIVDSLPPGDYRVSKLLTIPVGSGDRTFNTRGRPRNDQFTLEAGKITILHTTLDVLVYNQTPGRGMSTSYRSQIQPVTQAQEDEIMTRLEAMPNFSAWQIRSE